MITFLKFLENKEETVPEPWKFTKEQFVKHVMPFKTSQGSVYGHMIPYGSSFGKTVRIKSLHAHHDPNDKGLKKGSHKTVYVKPKDAQIIGLWNTLSSSGKRIVDNGDHFQLISINLITNKYGRDEESIPYKLQPEIGLAPVELWNPAEKPNWYQKNHPGNEITEFIPRDEAHGIFQDAAKINLPANPANQ